MKDSGKHNPVFHSSALNARPSHGERVPRTRFNVTPEVCAASTGGAWLGGPGAGGENIPMDQPGLSVPSCLSELRSQ